MDLGIAGRTALVLGGNRGIGLGIAKALAQESANVVIAARDTERLAAAAAELQAIAGRKVHSARIDLSETAKLADAVAHVVGMAGPIDILVNNTGGPAYGGASQRPAEEWRRRFDDMILSVITITDAVLPSMRARRWGRILTVISSGVVQPIPVLGISNTLRASLAGWSKTLSNEVAADGVTINIIVPGRIDTERVRQTDEAVAAAQNITVQEAARRSAATIPIGRYGTVDEIGAVAAFLASDRAGYVTGSMVRVDGGIVRSW